MSSSGNGDHLNGSGRLYDDIREIKSIVDEGATKTDKLVDAIHSLTIAVEKLSEKLDKTIPVKIVLIILLTTIVSFLGGKSVEVLFRALEHHLAL